MDFVKRATVLAENGNVKRALDIIYDRVDRMMREGKFQELDQIIAGLRVEDLHTDVLLGVLTTTGWAKSEIPSRGKFFDEVVRALKDRGHHGKGILDGLEQPDAQDCQDC